MTGAETLSLIFFMKSVVAPRQRQRQTAEVVPQVAEAEKAVDEKAVINKIEAEDVVDEIAVTDRVAVDAAVHLE